MISEQVARKGLVMARDLALQSICQKMRFGAVVIDEHDGLIGFGFNQPLVPQLCCLREGIRSGTELEKCTAYHAEQVAMTSALSLVGDLDRLRGATVVVAGLHPDGREWLRDTFPCSICARMMVALNLGYLVMPSPEGYRMIPAIQALAEALVVATTEPS